MEETPVVSSGYISLKRSVQLRVTVVRGKPLKTVILACITWRFLSWETAITNPKVARSLGEATKLRRLWLLYSK